MSPFHRGVHDETEGAERGSSNAIGQRTDQRPLRLVAGEGFARCRPRRLFKTLASTAAHLGAVGGRSHVTIWAEARRDERHYVEQLPG